jgi:hypothetical protein
MELIVQIFYDVGGRSSRMKRVRPFPGQFYSPEYRVWCSKALRESKTSGSLYRVNASLIFQPQGESYLRIGLDENWVPSEMR